MSYTYGENVIAATREVDRRQTMRILIIVLIVLVIIAILVLAYYFYLKIKASTAV